MPFGLGWLELSIILVIVIVIFGAGKLPEIGSSLGKSIRGFKTEISEGNKEIEEKKSTDKTATTVTPPSAASANTPTETRTAAAASAPKDDAVR